jgi:hypothetical protein
MKIKFLLVFFLLILSGNNFAQVPENFEHLLLSSSIDSSNPSTTIQHKIPLHLAVRNSNQTKFDPFSTEINYGTLAGMGAIALGTGIAVHIYQKNAWWKDQRSSFHFTNDWEYALWIDKVGHFYGAALLTHLLSAGFEAGNVQSESAAIYGALAATAFQMYVEIEDGFGPDWGFSIGDAAFNILGAGYALSQYYFPYLKNFQTKFSYYPSKKMREGIHKGNGIDDYEGQKYWISARVKNLLPDAVSKFWPAFLNIAVGMGVRDLDGSGGGKQEFYIALDLDAEEFPLYGPVWQFIKNSLNYIHFPMPGIRISPDAVFFVLCY